MSKTQYHFWWSKKQAENKAEECRIDGVQMKNNYALIDDKKVRYSSCHKVSSSDDFGQCSCRFSDAKYLGVGVISE